MLHVTPTVLETLVRSKPQVVIDFRAEWCAPCKAFEPAFHAAAKRHPQVQFTTIDVDDEPELAALFKVRSIPTVVLIRDGKVVYNRPGGLSDDRLDQLVTVS